LHNASLAPEASRRRRHWRLLIAALLLLLLAAPTADAMPGPLEHTRSMADPSVAKAGPHGYVAVATGPRVARLVSSNGVRWRSAGPALAARPSWAKPRSDIWASDIVAVKGRWLLYFAAPVRGMGRTSRCIGVAWSRTSTGGFRPVSPRPLVCPPAAHVPRAEDRILDRRRGRPTYPTIGAIDPSVFLDRARVFLLYKTDGRPSSIRLLRLSVDGLHASGRSRRLIAAKGVLENPVMVRHGRSFYLLMSQGDYSRCSYSTVWRRSRNLYRWAGHRQRTLLARRSTGLCGPGGADVVVDRSNVRLYFHAWTCHGSARPCGATLRASRRRHGVAAIRSLYGARIRFSRGGVRVASFLGTSVAAKHAAKHGKHGKHRREQHHVRRHHAKRHHAKRHHVTRHRARGARSV
jgi:arabinan endo-1,5-alpha-L-arabinosidase